MLSIDIPDNLAGCCFVDYKPSLTISEPER